MSKIPTLQAHTARPELYADLDAEGLVAAFKAYAETYDGGWARAVAAAVRAYEDKRWKPESAKPPEETEVLAEDVYGSFHAAEWDPTNFRWHNGDGGGVNVVRWTCITRPRHE